VRPGSPLGFILSSGKSSACSSQSSEGFQAQFVGLDGLFLGSVTAFMGFGQLSDQRQALLGRSAALI